MLSYIITAADTQGMGRVNFDSMPDQTLMEILVADIENNTAFHDGDGFLDIQSWEGLSFGDDGNLKKIDFAADVGMGLFADDSDEEDEDNFIIGPKGSIDLKWIPRSVKRFDIFWLKLSGTVETSELPENLEFFDIASNDFTGTFSIPSLPRKLTNVRISSNQLSGTLDIDKMPRTMEKFSAEQNQFHGKLNLSCLPKEIVTLRLGANNFSGEIDLRSIPSKMRFFSAHRTAIRQDKLVIKVPNEGVQYFRFSTRNFSEIVDTEGNDLKKAFTYMPTS